MVGGKKGDRATGPPRRGSPCSASPMGIYMDREEEAEISKTIWGPGQREQGRKNVLRAGWGVSGGLPGGGGSQAGPWRTGKGWIEGESRVEIPGRGKSKTKAERWATWNGRRRGDRACCGCEGKSRVHSDHFLPQTPTKFQLPAPEPLPDSIISCWPPLRVCWPQPPIGPSPTRTSTLESQAPSESQEPDQHHTPSPISRLTGSRRACLSKLGWGFCPPAPCA